MASDKPKAKPNPPPASMRMMNWPGDMRYQPASMSRWRIVDACVSLSSFSIACERGFWRVSNLRLSSSSSFLVTMLFCGTSENMKKNADAANAAAMMMTASGTCEPKKVIRRTARCG